MNQAFGLFRVRFQNFLFGLFYSQTQPGATVKHTEEGTESSAFWLSIGEKQDYTSNKLAPEATREPHLFSCSVNRGTSFSPFDIYPE